jgi:hypothetical protein
MMPRQKSNNERVRQEHKTTGVLLPRTQRQQFKNTEKQFKNTEKCLAGEAKKTLLKA